MGILAIEATWFRDGFSPQAPDGSDDFINEVRVAKQQHLNVRDIVLPANSDLGQTDRPENADTDFAKHFGWSQGARRYSHIVLHRFADRLLGEINRWLAANAVVDVFKIGNEVGGYCNNADVPDGHASSDDEFHIMVHDYGDFLKAAAPVIWGPNGMAAAKIVTFGMAEGSDRWDSPPHHVNNPGRLIVELRNYNDFKYFDNSQYRIDACYTHVSAWPNDIAQSIRETMARDEQMLGRDQPMWVTEWGFLDKRAFPNPAGVTPSQAVQESLVTV